MKNEEYSITDRISTDWENAARRNKLQNQKWARSLGDNKVDEEEVDEATTSGSGAGAYEGPLFGAIKKNNPLFKSNVKSQITQLTKEELLKTLNENKMSVGKATEAYRNAGLLLQHFKKEQQAVLDQFKASEPEEKETIKPILVYYHNIIKGLEIDVSAAEKEMEFAMGAESDDELVMEGAGAESSSGEFSTPSMWVPVDKNFKPKVSKMGHAKKPTWKGGKFVTVKKSCKTYPYCNQGDINSLELTDRAKDITESIHKETGMDINYIKSMIIRHMSEF